MTKNPALTVLIAESNPSRLLEMQSLVKELRPEWTTVCCATSVEELTIGLEEFLPQLMLLDMHLAGDGQTDWMGNLPSEVATIFVANDRQRAVDAFDYDAIDVLVRPYTKRRALKALERAQWRLARQRFDVGSDGPVPTPLAMEANHLNWIRMSRGSDLILVEPSDVIYLVADTKYTRLVTNKGEGLVRVALTTMMEHLDARKFVRVNRSAAVNLSYVSSIRRNDLGHMDVLLRERPEKLRVSKVAGGVFRCGI